MWRMEVLEAVVLNVQQVMGQLWLMQVYFVKLIHLDVYLNNSRLGVAGSLCDFHVPSLKPFTPLQERQHFKAWFLI